MTPAPFGPIIRLPATVIPCPCGKHYMIRGRPRPCVYRNLRDH